MELCPYQNNGSDQEMLSETKIVPNLGEVLSVRDSDYLSRKLISA